MRLLWNSTLPHGSLRSRVSSITSLRDQANKWRRPRIPLCPWVIGLCSHRTLQSLVLLRTLDTRSHPIWRGGEKSDATSSVKQEKDPSAGSGVLGTVGGGLRRGAEASQSLQGQLWLSHPRPHPGKCPRQAACLQESESWRRTAPPELL